MIVLRPIGPPKINGTISRLTIGRPVPPEVLAHWKETKQLESLVKGGFIGQPDEGKDSDGNEEAEAEKDQGNRQRGNDKK